MKNFVIILIGLTFVTLFNMNVQAIEPSEVIKLWPGNAPGEQGTLPPEADMTKPSDREVAGKRVVRWGNVTQPTLSIFRPSPEKNCGTAVLVCPGGGYNIVAADLEGTEICEWLNSHGITAGLLKYRVPRRQGLPKHSAPLQDAQRAMGLLRSRAADLKVEPNRIGIIGFSAGGHLSAALITSAAQRTYPTVDDADTNSCRPEFAMLIYPAYLTLTNDFKTLSPEVAVGPNHPPTFIVMAEDDPVHVENALTYAFELKRAKVPMELHIFASGGHGYGMRRTAEAVTRWPELAEKWLRGRGLLSRK